MSDLDGYATSLLRGRLVRLRALRDDDLPQLVQWWNDPETMVLQQHRVLPGPEAALTEMFRAWSANKDDSGAGFSIETHDGELVGHVTMWGIKPRTRIATLAIIIGLPHAGRGYGTDTLDVALRYAFDELAVNKVELQVWAFNSRAVHVYEKVGFVEEGRRRAAAYHRSAFHDEVLMGMLRDEFERRPATT
ncbi:GNAT family N-acetyltransferase [Actinoplanes sp. M2I2]|uniref:GNAT family N-acetyltransferase n=1 Tax=Actinoplanes sp. M2I2 TaxID=1734444 RepID=UPI002021FD64|nr:GNAT family protein [Actinoplanes sp. M2I2]